MIQTLVHDAESMIQKIREDIDTISETSDVGTEDFLTGIIQVYEKNLWMLRSSR